MRRRNPHTGLIVLWLKLRQRGYIRSVTSLYRILIKTNLMPEKPPNPKYVPKPYENMSFQGQRVQIYLKFVPSSCLVGEAKNFINIPHLMNIQDSDMLKPLKNTAVTVPQYFLNI